jgi:two-component system chemotaxis response regulator CheB
VKASGGRVIVEDPATAECRTMPAAALAATAVDYVLPLDRIGDHLVTLVEGTRA